VVGAAGGAAAVTAVTVASKNGTGARVLSDSSALERSWDVETDTEGTCGVEERAGEGSEVHRWKPFEFHKVLVFFRVFSTQNLRQHDGQLFLN
jgi:hypothetical protein